MGARYNSRLSGFQVDRATLDEHVLALAVEAGCELWRPAKLTALELGGIGRNRLEVRCGEETRTLEAKWVIDASGRAAVIARQRETFRPAHGAPDQCALGALHRREGLGRPRAAGEVSEVGRRDAHRARLGHQSPDGLRLVVLDHPAEGRRREHRAGVRFAALPAAGGRARSPSVCRRISWSIRSGASCSGEAQIVEGDQRAYSHAPVRLRAGGGRRLGAGRRRRGVHRSALQSGARFLRVHGADRAGAGRRARSRART